MILRDHPTMLTGHYPTDPHDQRDLTSEPTRDECQACHVHNSNSIDTNDNTGSRSERLGVFSSPPRDTKYSWLDTLEKRVDTDRTFCNTANSRSYPLPIRQRSSEEDRVQLERRRDLLLYPFLSLGSSIRKGISRSR